MVEELVGLADGEVSSVPLHAVSRRERARTATPARGVLRMEVGSFVR